MHLFKNSCTCYYSFHIIGRNQSCSKYLPSVPANLPLPTDTTESTTYPSSLKTNKGTAIFQSLLIQTADLSSHAIILKGKKLKLLMSYFYKCWNCKAHAVRTNITWKYVLWWGFIFWISTGWNRDFYILQLMLFSGSRVFHFANSEWMWPTTTTLTRDCESDSPLSCTCTVNCTCTNRHLHSHLPLFYTHTGLAVYTGE